MGDIIPMNVGLGYIRKLAECAGESKPGSVTPLWSLLQLLPPGVFLNVSPGHTKAESETSPFSPGYGVHYINRK